MRLQIGDVEVTETEARTQAAVALLVDTSFSMAMDGRWVPMKRTALALHTLITSRFRGDALQLIGFGRHAEVMQIEQLTALDAMWDKGTNLHHALLLANRHFRKHPTAQPVLLIVTDGEPTSHLEPDGEVYFAYPPHPLTVAYAVRELDNSGRLGAQTTFFRLGDDPGLARFVDSMARRVDGRVVAPELDDLGAAVVGSYLGARGGRSRPASTTATGTAGAGSGWATEPDGSGGQARGAGDRAALGGQLGPHDLPAGSASQPHRRDSALTIAIPRPVISSRDGRCCSARPSTASWMAMHTTPIDRSTDTRNGESACRTAFVASSDATSSASAVIASSRHRRRTPVTKRRTAGTASGTGMKTCEKWPLTPSPYGSPSE